MGILLLAQLLIGALSFSALNQLIADMNADRVENVARRLQDDIENGLHMGKPLAQFFGLGALLEDVLTHSRETFGATVVLPSGERIAEYGLRIAEAKNMLPALLSPEIARPDENMRFRASGAILQTTRDRTLLATLLCDADGSTRGVLLVQMDNDTEIFERLIVESFRTLLLITLFTAAALAAVFKYLLPDFMLSSQSRWRLLVPILALSLAQGGYALHVVATFRDAWLEVIQENVEELSAEFARNLNRILGYGFDLDHLRDIEAPFSRLAGMSPIISIIDLVDREGKVLNRANAEGALRVEGTIPRNVQRLRLPLGQALERPEAKGALVFYLDAETIASGVWNQGLDAVTVVVISLVTAIEMLLLSFLVMNRAPRWTNPGTAPPPDGAAHLGKLVRPILFGFVFAWALPLGFLPIYARSLMASGDSPLPQNLLLALPVALEMAFGLLATLTTGGMADRRGWQMPPLLGLAAFSLGMVLCALADNLYFLMFARCVVGLGYGFVWMGLQSFVVTHSPKRTQGRSMTEIIAGIFAGHLSGAAIGAMLVVQTGFRPVFAIGAVMALLPLLGIFTLMRPYMTASPRSLASFAVRPLPAAPAPDVSRLRETLHLLGTRGFGCLLSGCVIPFSIIQVGLLYFALPLYLESVDVPASSVGRVLMAYGLCVVYIGPLMGRHIDRSALPKKDWILWGSLLAGSSLFGFYIVEGVIGAVLAVVALALASCCLGASQSPYMLALPEVRGYGAASAISLLRAADKLGQMAGPLIIGVLFGVLSVHASLTVTGLFCLVAVLPFAFFAPRRAPDPGIASR
jgi:predicted MFS family arabinose efflux permease